MIDTKRALRESLKADLNDIETTLRHAGDILATRHERLGVAFSDVEVAKSLHVDCSRALWSLISQVYAWGEDTQ